jgi:HD-GYP domain-containing protein (c-di-GMP phosphodiesterase class II)
MQEVSAARGSGSSGIANRGRGACFAVKTGPGADDTLRTMASENPYEFAPEELTFLQGEEANAPTVLAWRPAEDWGDVRGLVVRTDARVAELMLSLVRETAAARNEEARLLDVIARFAFRAFPNASHHVLVARHHDEAPLRTLIAAAKSGDHSRVPLSRTIVDRVLRDGHAMLYVQGPDPSREAESIVLSRLETAIVAPLMGSRKPFGVLQLDVRRPARGRFTQEDMEMLSVFASQVGLALEHLWLHQQQQRAFQSTISALVHSLLLKDPESAKHSERVQLVSLAIGRRLGLSPTETEILSVASLLHDLGKQGVSDEVLFKPGKLTAEEKQEMDLHAAYTQSILDMIEYPANLWDVPRIAAYHHEKIDGSGPFGVAGDDIPRAARIISVADVFDALVSSRRYKSAMSPQDVLALLKRGQGHDWDAVVVRALRDVADEVLREVYAMDSDGRVGTPPREDEGPIEKAA